AANEQERLNPENGICLSALYDKAFDKGLIGINANYEVILSVNLNKKKNKRLLCKVLCLNRKRKIANATKVFAEDGVFGMA
ncbi:MAG: HNH endonuclease, partial [Bacteroidales bacterium]|nr:HNH endonuclease [Bacteroidales bacterium]